MPLIGYRKIGMIADPPFFDSCYLVRLYLEEKGFQAVRDVAESSTSIAAAWHAQAEVITAFHRAFRERQLSQHSFQSLLDQFDRDNDNGLFDWLPLTQMAQKRLESKFRNIPVTTFLRAADALHLACAAENGFTTVYSNDRHLLVAAGLFGLKGINVIP